MTTEKINNPPAFPWGGDLNDCPTINLGMTLRDYFAAKAMQGLVAARDRPSGKAIVEYSYKMADAMLKESAK
tara:strand:+ start:1378 stop:1593 length:216 start_codon:yes stop_codon:yes gene_type:complete